MFPTAAQSARLEFRQILSLWRLQRDGQLQVPIRSVDRVSGLHALYQCEAPVKENRVTRILTVKTIRNEFF